MKNNFFSYKPTDGDETYDVCYGNNVDNLKFYLQNKVTQYKSPIYIVDENLPLEYVQTVKKITGFSEKNTVYVNTDKKTLDRIEKIWNNMVSTVPDVVIIIGGGTICDLGGFASATYQRGIPRVLFPTTVLAMVDASIGGKVGIDFGEVKNSIGALHYPILTINYLQFLKTLNKEEYNSGFAEIIKAAVLYDKSFFEKLYLYRKKPRGESKEELEVFFTSSKLKANVCEAKSKKKISLLYGHSVGHAIERYESTHLRHGDCVAIGMTIEGAMACVLGIWKKEEWEKQQELIESFDLPTKLPEYINLEDLSKKMRLYKKLINTENYLFSLPKSIGEINESNNNYLTPVKRERIVEILKATLHWISLNKKGD